MVLVWPWRTCLRPNWNTPLDYPYMTCYLKYTKHFALKPIFKEIFVMLWNLTTMTMEKLLLRSNIFGVSIYFFVVSMSYHAKFRELFTKWAIFPSWSPTSEVKQGCRVVFVYYDVGMSILERTRFVRHRWRDVHSCRQVGMPALQWSRIGQAMLEGCFCWLWVRHVSMSALQRSRLVRLGWG